MLKDILGQAWEAMLYNRRRTAITMIGMAWGIATVVLLLAYGAGFSHAIEAIFANWGTNTIMVFPGRTSEQAGGDKAGAWIRFTLDDVARVNARLAAELAREAVRFEKIYVAPEAPDQPSRARKPSPQFLLDARDEFGVRLEESFIIGDKLIDLECGWNAGVKKSILVRTGYGKSVENSGDPRLAMALVADDLAAAAGWILQQK